MGYGQLLWRDRRILFVAILMLVIALRRVALLMPIVRFRITSFLPSRHKPELLFKNRVAASRKRKKRGAVFMCEQSSHGHDSMYRVGTRPAISPGKIEAGRDSE